MEIVNSGAWMGTMTISHSRGWRGVLWQGVCMAWCFSLLCLYLIKSTQRNKGHFVERRTMLRHQNRLLFYISMGTEAWANSKTQFFFSYLSLRASGLESYAFESLCQSLTTKPQNSKVATQRLKHEKGFFKKKNKIRSSRSRSQPTPQEETKWFVLFMNE